MLGYVSSARFVCIALMDLIRFGGPVDYVDRVSSSFVEESLQVLGGIRIRHPAFARGCRRAPRRFRTLRRISNSTRCRLPELPVPAIAELPLNPSTARASTLPFG
jgi:hypothetical protein